MYRDGPLSIRPPEEITYGTGKCVLGHLLVAVSGKGIVTIMVRENAAQLVADLLPRFPKADLVRDEKGCKGVVAKVAAYIAAPFKPFPLRLDIRGTAFQKAVWIEVRKIPFGETSTYSKIAEAIGAPKAVRAVGSSCTHCWFAWAVPCHRVLSRGEAAAKKKEGRRYRWVAYEADLVAKRGKGPHGPTLKSEYLTPNHMKKPRTD